MPGAFYTEHMYTGGKNLPRKSRYHFFSHSRLSLRLSQRGGHIKARLIALILLVIGVSLLLSAYRSLSRTFSGLVVNRQEDVHLSRAFWVFLAAPHLAGETATGSGHIMHLLRDDIPSRRVGVSRVVFQNADFFEKMEKEAFSPFITVGEDRFLDLGLQWLVWGLISLVAACFAYHQASTGLAHPPTEEVSPFDLEQR